MLTGCRRRTAGPAGPTTSSTWGTSSTCRTFPTRGRSQYVPGVDGTAGQLNLNIRTAPNLEETFTAAAARGNFPQAKKHTQWPGTGRIGDKVFDDFAKTQVQFLAGGGRRR